MVSLGKLHFFHVGAAEEKRCSSVRSSAGGGRFPAARIPGQSGKGYCRDPCPVLYQNGGICMEHKPQPVGVDKFEHLVMRKCLRISKESNVPADTGTSEK